MRRLPPLARLSILCLTLALAAGCGGGGGGSTVPTAPVVQRPALPVLTTLAVVLPQDTVQASLTVTATVVAADEKAQAMTVGLVEWTSSNPAVATITSGGTILARATGTTVIRAKVGQVEGARTLLVLPPPPGPLPVASIALTPTAQALDVGSTQRLDVALRDFAGTLLADREVTFSSSDESIALVAADGTITARSAGTAIIEAASEGQRTASAITVRSALDPGIELAVSQPLPGAEVGDSVNLIATVRSVQPLDSVVLTISGRSYPMIVRMVSNGPAVSQPTWVVTADLSTLVGGPLALVITATDAAGGRGVLVVPVVHRTLVPGGNKTPGGSK